MILHKEITGFYDAKGEQIPMVDHKQYKQLYFSVMKKLSGDVIGVSNQCCHSNFIAMEVKLRGTKLYILLNKHYPIVASASNVEFGSVTFKDHPSLSEQFSPYYRILSYSELNEPVLLNLGTKVCLLQNENELDQAELKQVAYWKPETIGEIIFNHWD